LVESRRLVVLELGEIAASITDVLFLYLLGLDYSTREIAQEISCNHKGEGEREKRSHQKAVGNTAR